MSDQATLGEFTSTTDTDESESDTDSGKRRYRDEDWLREQYWKQGKSTTDLADEAGVSRTTIRKWMNKHGIERRSQSEAQTNGNIELLNDPDWLHQQYCENQRTAYDIAEELEISSGTVYNRMEEYGIDSRDRSEARTDGNIELLKDPEWLREQYWDMQRTSLDIAEECSVDSGTVLGWMEEHGIERRSQSEAQTDGNIEKLTSSDWLRAQYVDQKRSAEDIAEELGVTAPTVRSYAREHDIQIRSLSEASTEGDTAPLQDGDWLYEQYCEKERTTTDIANELGLTKSTVCTWMDKHGIERRSTSEIQAGGNIEPLKQEEWLRSQYWKQDRTLSQIANELDTGPRTVHRYMERHGIETRSSEGSLSYPSHLDHPVRSDWELVIADLLTDHDIPYQYESMSIGYGEGRTYTPDFVTDDYVIEVKGRIFDDGSEEQKARAAMDALKHREYVVVGTELPADHHFSWDKRDAIIALFG